MQEIPQKYNKLLEILACPKCKKPLIDQSNQKLECIECDKSYPVINGQPRFYDVEVKDIQSSAGQNATTPITWTGWRKKNYAYFEGQLLTLRPGSSLLDIGAGPAHFSKLLGKFNHFSTDFDNYSGIDFLTDLNKAFPVKSESLDIVLASNVLEHIAEPLKLLSECFRVLKQRGRLIITVPFLIKIHQAPYDYHRYTEFMLDRMFREVGFKEFSIERIGNVISVNEVVRRAYIKHMINGLSSGGIKLRAIIYLFRLSSFLDRCSISIGGKRLEDSEDTLGYPQGYGCVAIK